MISVDLKKSGGGLLDYGYGKTIRSRGLVNISKDANFGWASAGARIAGRSWEEEGGHEVGPSFDFLPYNGLIARSRQESRGLGGPSPKSVIYVLVESEGSCSLEVNLLPYFESGSNPSANQTSYATGTASRGWSRIRFVVTDSDSGAIKIAVSAASSIAGAKIWAVSVVEAPYRNLESTLEPVALGDFNVGPYQHNGEASAWSRGTNDPDSLTLGFDGEGSSANRLMRRNDPADGVHSVNFVGSAWMKSTGTVTGFGAGDLLASVAVKIDPAAPNGYILRCGNAVQIYASTTANQIQAHHYDSGGGFSIISSSFLPSGWADIATLYSGGEATLWINGNVAATGTYSGGHDDSAAFVLAGYEGHQLAMPSFFAGSISSDDAREYIDYRRHVHGIF